MSRINRYTKNRYLHSEIHKAPDIGISCTKYSKRHFMQKYGISCANITC